MSVLGSIMSRIFGHRAAASPPSADAAPAAPAQAAPDDRPAAAQVAPGTAQPGAEAASRSPSAGAPVDVAAVLEDMATRNSQRLDWRHSIVDLMKLLGLDSGLEARRELAKELGYGGDTGDSAAMNIWLHGQVMRKLAENGGQVPAELRS